MTAVNEQGAVPRIRGGWRRAAVWVLAAAFYTTLTIVQTWPLVTRLADVLPHDLGDPGLNAWIIWWNAQAVPLTERWWNAPIFFPSSGTLAFSETLLGLLPITAPIQWFGGSPITAYNVAFLLTFPLSALAAHALVCEVDRPPRRRPDCRPGLRVQPVPDRSLSPDPGDDLVLDAALAARPPSSTRRAERRDGWCSSARPG